jgi:hypothetical protein
MSGTRRRSAGAKRRTVVLGRSITEVHLISSVRPQFGTRPSPTRSGERGEAVQGLNDAARVPAAAPQRPRWTAHGRQAAGSATAWGKVERWRGKVCSPHGDELGTA